LSAVLFLFAAKCLAYPSVEFIDLKAANDFKKAELPMPRAQLEPSARFIHQGPFGMRIMAVIFGLPAENSRPKNSTAPLYRSRRDLPLY